MDSCNESIDTHIAIDSIEYAAKTSINHRSSPKLLPPTTKLPNHMEASEQDENTKNYWSQIQDHIYMFIWMPTSKWMTNFMNMGKKLFI